MEIKAYLRTGSICFSVSNVSNKASAYFGMEPVPRNSTTQHASTLRTRPISPSHMAALNSSNTRASKLNKVMFLNTLSRSSSGCLRISSTRRREVMRVYTRFAVSAMSCISETLSAHSDSESLPHSRHQPSRTFAGSANVKISSDNGWKGAGFDAFQPQIMGRRQSNVFTFQSVLIASPFGFPQYSFPTIRVPAIFTWNRPSNLSTHRLKLSTRSSSHL